MIQVKDLRKTLKNGHKVLDGISFTVNKGEFVGILGPSGAGKTLTIRCLNGLLKPDSGEVIIDIGDKQYDICKVSKKELRQIRQKIGLIFQGYHLVKRSTVLENVLIGKLGQISTLRSIFFGFNDTEAAEALKALERVNMESKAGRLVAGLSGGEMQRVAIARALFQSPGFLIADEPISDLDPSNSHIIMKMIKPLSENIPVIGVFHQPELTAKYCTRVIAIKEGKLIYDGAPKLTNQQLVEIYGEELNQLQEELIVPNEIINHAQVE